MWLSNGSSCSLVVFTSGAASITFWCDPGSDCHQRLFQLWRCSRQHRLCSWCGRGICPCCALWGSSPSLTSQQVLVFLSLSPSQQAPGVSGSCNSWLERGFSLTVPPIPSTSPKQAKIFENLFTCGREGWTRSMSSAGCARLCSPVRTSSPLPQHSECAAVSAWVPYGSLPI